MKKTETMTGKSKSDYMNYILEQVARSISSDKIYAQVLLELRKKSNYSEFELAQKLDIDIKSFRRIIYALFERGLLFWRRKKDRQRGWYIYYWTLKEDEIPFYYERVLKRKLKMLKERLAKEEGQHYLMCPNFCVRVSYEQAIDLNFTCPECGAVLVEQDNSKTVANLKKAISEIELELSKLKKSELLKSFAKKADTWYSSGNLFSKTKKRKETVETDIFEEIMREVTPKDDYFVEDE